MVSVLTKITCIIISTGDNELKVKSKWVQSCSEKGVASSVWYELLCICLNTKCSQLPVFSSYSVLMCFFSHTVRCYYYNVSFLKNTCTPNRHPIAHPWGWDMSYHKTSNIRCTFVGTKIVDYSDAVGALPVGTAPTTSSFSTYRLAALDWTKPITRRGEKHLSVGIWCALY